MAEYAPSPSCINMHLKKSYIMESSYAPRSLHLRMAHRKSLRRSCNVLWPSMWKMCKLGPPAFTSQKASPSLLTNSFKFSCFGPLADIDGITTDWIPISDRVLLLASMFLTYAAGVIPMPKPTFSSRKNLSENTVTETPKSSGRARENPDEGNLKPAWDAVKEKLLNSLDVIERESSLGTRVLQCEQQQPKAPLSLNAISQGPKFWLLWACFQHLEEEVNNISRDVDNVDDWMAIFSEMLLKSCKQACNAWQENVFSQDNSNIKKASGSFMIAKLTGDEAILQSIRKSGKEDLYAEFMYFNIYGSHRNGCCYDQGLFHLNGVSILEDLVITLADGIASSYLELISVDGDLSNELNSMGLDICNLSTRALQKLRNEVALNQWMYQNVEAVVSMYEDRFDLFTLQNRVVEKTNEDGTERYSWWKKLRFGTHGAVSSQLRYSVMSHFSMPVKRTKELRALTGWRYYFSLFLELADISMPFIRAVVDKVSGGISFFLVSLIGRSLGLIYTGIRQALRWK